MIRNPYGVYFLSRPRRFGKSLLISTLEEIFRGSKELFQGLWLYDSPYQWQPHPVIRVDFSMRRVETAEELKQVLGEFLQDLAGQNGVTFEAALLEEIKSWYDGYCFSSRCQSVYNPFSLLLLFAGQEFRNYWFETGTPTFLIELVKQQDLDITQLSDLEVDELSFSTYEIENLDVLPLLFQAGYLTIKAYDPAMRLFTLGYPNYEVEHAFMRYLLSSC